MRGGLYRVSEIHVVITNGAKINNRNAASAVIYVLTERAYGLPPKALFTNGAGAEATAVIASGQGSAIVSESEGCRCGLNSPNDVVPHPDGSVWFTDPPYGGQFHEGEPDAAGGASNPDGRFNPRIGQPAGFAGFKRELPTNCYRVDPSGKIQIVVTEDQVPDPNGILFSPDHKKLYVISTGKGPGDKGPGGKNDISVFDVGPDNKPSNQRLFTDCVVDGIKCGPDGMRCDVAGNVWVSSNAGRNVGYSGVTVWNPDGKLIGRIRLPEVVANISFGGPKRNRLFMAASQSLSGPEV